MSVPEQAGVAPPSPYSIASQRTSLRFSFSSHYPGPSYQRQGFERSVCFSPYTRPTLLCPTKHLFHQPSSTRVCVCARRRECRASTPREPSHDKRPRGIANSFRPIPMEESRIVFQAIHLISISALSPLPHIYSTGTCAPDRTHLFNIVSMVNAPFGHKTLKFFQNSVDPRFPSPDHSGARPGRATVRHAPNQALPIDAPRPANTKPTESNGRSGARERLPADCRHGPVTARMLAPYI